MYKEARIFVLISLIVMGAFGYGVRAYMMAPKMAVGGTILTSHDTSARFAADCSACHISEKEWHESVFSRFDKNECMNCHGGAPGIRHSTDGNYADCMTCHSTIVSGHDALFNFPNTSYEDCLSCHQQL